MSSDFTKGYFCACAVSMKQYGYTSEVYEMAAENYQSLQALRNDGVDEHDIAVLMPVFKEIERKRKLRQEYLSETKPE